MLGSANVFVEASSVPAAGGRHPSNAILASGNNNKKRHLRAAAAARSMDEALMALEATEAEEAEEEEEEEEEPLVEERDQDDRDPIPEDEDLTPEEAAAAEELTAGADKADAPEIAEEDEGNEGAGEQDPAGDDGKDGSDVPEIATEEESPAIGATEGTGGDDEGQDEATPTEDEIATEEESPATGATEGTPTEDEEMAFDEEILDELANEEGELPEDVVEQINDEIEDILDAVAEATSGEPTMMGTAINSVEDGFGDKEPFDEDTEQAWAPVGAPTVQAPTVDYGNDEAGSAPTGDYFEYQMTPEPTKPYTPPDEDYDPLDGIDAEETLGYEEESSYGSTSGGSSKEPVESPFEDGSWQDNAYKQAYDWLNGVDGEEDMAAVARDQRVKVAVGVLLGLGVALALVTASCALNNPDGLCAGCCRLVLKLLSCICHVLCLPCRMCCGGKRQEDRHGATLVGRSDLEFS